MAITAEEFEYRLSGGAGNAVPDSSLGGVISTTLLAGASIAEGTTITGVTIDRSSGMGSTAADLVYTQATNTFTFNGGAGVVVSADGTYFIPNTGTNGGYVVITVVFASLPGSDVTNTLTPTPAANNLFDDILQAEVLAGATEYRCIYGINTSGTDAYTDLTWSIQNQPNGLDNIEIGIDPAGTGTATTIANELAVPAGVTFGTASINVSGGLALGATSALWIKRTIPATSGPLIAVDLATIKAEVTYVQ